LVLDENVESINLDVAEFYHFGNGWGTVHSVYASFEVRTGSRLFWKYCSSKADCVAQ
jgi:hypothetical protein